MSREAGQGPDDQGRTDIGAPHLRANKSMDARRLGLRERSLGRALLSLRVELMAPHLTNRGSAALGVVAGCAVMVGVSLCLPWYRWPDSRTISALDASQAGPVRWASLVFVLACALGPVGLRLSDHVDVQARWLVALRWLVSVTGVTLLLIAARTMTNEDLWREPGGPAWGVLALIPSVLIAIVATFVVRSGPTRSVSLPVNALGTEPSAPLSSDEIDRQALRLLGELVDSVPPSSGDTGPRWAAVVIPVAAALFGASAFATLAPWEQFDFPALGAEGLDRVGDLPLVSQAITLSLAALACTVTSVLARRASRWVAAAAVLSGSATSAALFVVARSIPVRGGLADIQLGLAPKVGVAAAIVATLLVATVQIAAARPSGGGLWVSGGLYSTVGLVVVALLGGGAFGAVAARDRAVQADPGGGLEVVMGGGLQSPPWGRVASEGDLSNDDQVDADSLDLTIGAEVAVDLDGGPGIWSFSETSNGLVASASIDGRLIPQVSISGGDYRVGPVGVTGQTAIMVATDENGAVVFGVPFDRPQVWLPRTLAVDSGDGPGFDEELIDATELLRVPSDDRPVLRSVDVVADGSLAVTVRNDDETELYLVPHDRLSDPEAWKLDSPVTRLPELTSLTAGPDGSVLATTGSGLRLLGENGRVVLDGSADPDCAISNQPLEINLDGIRDIAVDRDGNRWVAVGRTEGPQMLVQRPDGEIRLVPPGVAFVTSLVAAPNGDLVIGGYSEGAFTPTVLRLPQAADLVDGLQPAPEIAPSCTKRSEVGLTTLGASFERVPTDVGPADQLVAADGTVVTENSADSDRPGQLELRSPDGTIEEIADRSVDGEYVGDGLGGVWWVDVADPSDERLRPALMHRAADGELFKRDLPTDLIPDHLSADPSTGDLFFLNRPGDLNLEWFRIPIGGSARPLTAAEVELLTVDSSQVLGRGETIVQRDDDALISVEQGTGRTLLGDRDAAELTLPFDVAVAEDAPLERYPVGPVAVGPDGVPWMLVDGYLVRVPEEGVVEVLAGPDDGLPPDALTLVPLGDDMFVRTETALLKVVVS